MEWMELVALQNVRHIRRSVKVHLPYQTLNDQSIRAVDRLLRNGVAPPISLDAVSRPSENSGHEDDFEQPGSSGPRHLDRQGEAAGYLRIKTRQPYNWRSAGLIPDIRIGRAIRFRKSAIDAALARMTRGGL
jgi:excisionase family DNA binding protein